MSTECLRLTLSKAAGYLEKYAVLLSEKVKNKKQGET